MLRQVESATCADFDVLGNNIITSSSPVVINGFTISISPSPIGQPANQLYLTTAGGTVCHPLASEAGSFFTVPTNRSPELLNSLSNTNVYGTFSASASNIVGIDLIRTSDPTTNNLASFIPAGAIPNSSNNQEIQQIVPFARTLNYRIVISNSLFGNASNICPIAIVTTDSNNNVVSIEDARPLMFRLGSGSDAPNPYNIYSWPQSRVENPITFSSSTLYNPFSGGDKSIQSLKDWANSIMQRLQETAGGQYWYNPVSNWSTMKLLFGNFVSISANMVQTPNGSGAAYLQWSGLWVACDNADLTSVGGPTQVTVFQIADQLVPSVVSLSDGQCLYVDVDRSMQVSSAIPLNAHVGTLDNLGLPPPPYTRFIIAWAITVNGQVVIYNRDSTFKIGQPGPIATTTTYGVVELDSSSHLSPQLNQAYVPNSAGPSSPNPGTVIATGISLGDGVNVPYYNSGTLSLGMLAEDITIDLGGSSTTTLNILNNNANTGTAYILGGINNSGTLNLLTGNSNSGNINIGNGPNNSGHFNVFAGTSDTGAINIGTNSAGNISFMTGTASGNFYVGGTSNYTGNISLGYYTNPTTTLAGKTLNLLSGSGSSNIVSTVNIISENTGGNSASINITSQSSGTSSNSPSIFLTATNPGTAAFSNSSVYLDASTSSSINSTSVVWLAPTTANAVKIGNSSSNPFLTITSPYVTLSPGPSAPFTSAAFFGNIYLGDSGASADSTSTYIAGPSLSIGNVPAGNGFETHILDANTTAYGHSNITLGSSFSLSGGSWGSDTYATDFSGNVVLNVLTSTSIPAHSSVTLFTVNFATPYSVSITPTVVYSWARN